MTWATGQLPALKLVKQSVMICDEIGSFCRSDIIAFEKKILDDHSI